MNNFFYLRHYVVARMFLLTLLSDFLCPVYDDVAAKFFTQPVLRHRLAKEADLFVSYPKTQKPHI